MIAMATIYDQRRNNEIAYHIMIDIHFCMDQHPTDWTHYRSFKAVADTGSLSGAARQLKLTQPTVGRHIEALEAALGVSLFTRAPQGMTPTPAALDILPHAAAMAAAAQSAVRAASGSAEALTGTVRLTASEVISMEVLPAILADFHNIHPGIDLEIVPTNRVEDLLRRDADIAIRMAPPVQKALVVRHIGPLDVALYAHRDYLAAHGMPETLDALVAHTIIGFDRDMSLIEARDDMPFPLTRDLFRIRSDSDLAQLALLRGGLGVGGCQVGIARRDADLVPIMPEAIRFGLDMWIAMHEDQRNSRRIRVLFDHLVEAMSAYVLSSRLTPDET